MNGHCCASVSRPILTSLLGGKMARTVAVFSALVGAGMDLFAVRTISFCSAQRLLINGIADDRSWFGPQRIRPRNRSQPRYGSLPIVATFTLSDRRWRWRVRQSFHETTFVARKLGIQRCSKEWILVAEIGDIPSREAGEFFQSRS